MSMHAPGAQPEIAAEPDQVRHELALELGELGDLSRGQELAQSGVDPGADATKLATSTGGDELGDRRRAATDRVSAARR